MVRAVERTATPDPRREGRPGSFFFFTAHILQPRLIDAATFPCVIDVDSGLSRI